MAASWLLAAAAGAPQALAGDPAVGAARNLKLEDLAIRVAVESDPEARAGRIRRQLRRLAGDARRALEQEDLAGEAAALEGRSAPERVYPEAPRAAAAQGTPAGRGAAPAQGSPSNQHAAAGREATAPQGATHSDARLGERRERFNRFFFSEAGFRPEAESQSAEALLIHHVLERRRGSCVGLAQVYLVLAERLGLPVVAAATPSHLLARWVEADARLNTELLEQGAEHSDSEYRHRHRIEEADPSNPVFLRDLEPGEVAARIYNNRGVIRSRAGLLEAAAADYARAIELDPRFPAPHYNRALDELNAGHPREALAGFDAALDLHRADSWALNNRGLAQLRLGRRAEALEDFRRALVIEPDFPAARKNLALLDAEVGRTAADPHAVSAEPDAAGPRP